MLTYHSAAKINLYLSVKGKLPRGYHELTSIMQSVSLFDTLIIDFGQRNFSLSVPDFDLGSSENNIVTRVWRLMQAKFKLPKEVSVTIKKCIPVGAGLAGGSSNGAAMLHAVNDYFNLGLTLAELCSLGSEIGADIPFCVMGGTALATGKGEILKRLPDLPRCPILLTNAGFSVSTQEVFADFDKLPLLSNNGDETMIKALESGDVNAVSQCLYNDLERVTLDKYASLVNLKEKWQQRGCYPLMSGSGPSVFALAMTEDEDKIKGFLSEVDDSIFLVYPEGQGIYK